ncbi:MAG: hypothetical protein A3F17_01315 [Gammaproteobacteria bacterium RIFCSPHIGHO2_12_FULL_41_15]|nr:MAG: hypothetical protein A3F17_01315 [Gammaproteobacteria bacterium RIFCSPHIGHO2_12_FULL_41_15]
MVILLKNLSGYAQENIESSKLKSPIIGIIVPLQDESLFLQKNIVHNKIVIISGVKYNIGTINNKNVVFVNSGLGKVNSAVITTRLIKDFHPNLILMSGSSGNINAAVKKWNVVIGKRVINADFGELTSNGTQFQYSQYLLSPQTNTTLPLEFDLDNHLLKLINHLDDDHLPKIVLGNIATSDALPNQASQIKILREGKFDVIEMEGASLMQVCWLFNISCIVIRGVSNNAEEPITQQDIKLAADNAAKVLIKIVSNYKN